MRSVASALLKLLRVASFSPEKEPQPAIPRYDEMHRFLLRLDMPNGSARTYLEGHLDRMAVTLSIVPQPAHTGRILELGSYMQMTPALGLILGYPEVLGAYYGQLGESSCRTASVAGEQVFDCRIDRFNAELDRYPYVESTFDCVLACEIFEHFLHDPVHMLAEVWRILGDGGTLVLTTPNAASTTAVIRTFEQFENPQFYSKYADPRLANSAAEVGHMREYTAAELRRVLESSGFDIVELFTRNAPGYASDRRITSLLQMLGYSTKFRGEQMFCVARKSSRGIAERYPSFLYEI